MGLIRFYLAAAVVLAHNGFKSPGVEGYISVMIFFMISGYYMSMVLNEKYTKSVGVFFMSRFLRLWPSYIIVFLATYVYVGGMGSQIYEGITSSILVWFSSITMLMYHILNWFGVSSTGDLVFLNQGIRTSGVYPLVYATHMEQMWSIGIEICFYITAPFIARRVRLLILLMVCFASYYVIMRYFYAQSSPLINRSALSSFWLFLSGMLSYHLFVLLKTRSWMRYLKYGYVAPASLALSILLVYTLQVYFYNPYVVVVCMLSFSLLIPIIFYSSKYNSIDRFIGELSYPLYLVHWPIVAYVFTDHRGDFLWSVMLLGASVFLAIVLYIIVDKNIDKVRVKLSS